MFEQSPILFNKLELIIFDPNSNKDIKHVVDLIKWNE
jgi:hypothetical protein